MNPSFRGCLRSVFRPLLCGLLGLAGLGLGACSESVGSGVAPLNVVITSPGTTIPVTSMQMYECLVSSLGAVMYFSNGSAGNFTGRVTWSSSNSGTLEVSNGDIPIPGTTASFYPAGTLVPQHTGTAVITANYFGIVNQTTVTVSAPEYFVMQAIVQGSRVPLSLYNDPYKTGNSPYGNNFYMGSGTSVQLSAIANLNGVETDVTLDGVWGFQNAADDGTAGATVNATTGLLTAGASGASTQLVPTITFPSCPQELTSPLNQYTMTVEPVSGVVLSPEFDPGTPASSGTPASVPTSITLYPSTEERINTIGTLNNGALQDVSASTTLVSSTSSTLVFVGNGAGTNNVLEALALSGGVNQTTVSGTFAAAGATLLPNQLQVASPAASFSTYYICWTSPYVAFNPSSCSQTQSLSQTPAQVTAGSLTPVQYHAVGIFGFDSSGNEIVQEVTRTSTWTVGNASATISTSAATIGQVLGVTAGKDVISVANSAAINTGGNVSAQVTVNPTSGVGSTD